MATATSVSIANAFATASPPLLECVDSQKAIFRPTQEWFALKIDALWQWFDNSEDCDLTITRAETQENGQVLVKK